MTDVPDDIAFIQLVVRVEDRLLDAFGEDYIRDELEGAVVEAHGDLVNELYDMEQADG